MQRSRYDARPTSPHCQASSPQVRADLICNLLDFTHKEVLIILYA
ncbi:MAG TPA: hypothetical protein VKZ56_04000 [Membranihabitans sp.]|nr:hypothetical protein [Membranihabitans sp.]